MVALLFVIGWLLSMCSAVCYKQFSVISSGYRRITSGFVALWTGCAGLLFGVVQLCTVGAFVRSETIVTGVFAGFFFVLAAHLYIKALEIGPFIWTVLLMNLSNFLPVLTSAVILKERASPLQMAGVALMLAVVGLAAWGRTSQNHSFSAKWLIVATFMTVTNGGIGSVMKVQRFLVPEGEATAYLSVMFLSCALFSLVAYLFTRDKKEVFPLRRSFLPAVGLIGSIGFATYLQMALTARVSAVVQYPVNTAGGIVFSAVAALFLYKEKMTVKLFVSVFMVVGGVFLLSV